MIFFSCFSDTANSSISAIDSRTTFFQPLIQTFENNSSSIYLATKAKASFAFLSKLQEANKLSYSHKKRAIAFQNISNSFDDKLNLTTTAATITNNNLTSSVEGVTETTMQPVTSESTIDSNFTANSSTTNFVTRKDVTILSSTSEIITKFSRIGKYFVFICSSSLKGIHSRSDTNRTGAEGLSFLLLQTAALPESDAGSGVIKPASSFFIQNRQTACSMWCPMYRARC